MVACLFTPKLYIILVHPERNVRQSMMPATRYSALASNAGGVGLGGGGNSTGPHPPHGPPSNAIQMMPLTPGSNHVGNPYPPKPKVDCATQSDGKKC